MVFHAQFTPQFGPNPIATNHKSTNAPQPPNLIRLTTQQLANCLTGKSRQSIPENFVLTLDNQATDGVDGFRTNLKGGIKILNIPHNTNPATIKAFIETFQPPHIFAEEPIDLSKMNLPEDYNPNITNPKQQPTTEAEHGSQQTP